MSTVLMRREVPPVCFDADECGAVFATEAADVQAEFLKAWAATAYKFDWPQQCRMIADELDANDRVKAIGILAALLEHLREPVSDAIAFR